MVGGACAASAASYPMRGMSTAHLLFLALCSHGEGSNKNEDASRGRVEGNVISHAAWDGASSMCSEGLCLAAQFVDCDAEYGRRESMCVKHCDARNEY